VKLLVRDNYIDVVLTPEAMIGYGEETIAVRRQVNPGDGSALI